MKSQSNYYHTSCQHNSQESQTPGPYLEPLPAAELARHLLRGGNRHSVALSNIYAVIKNAVAPAGVPAVGGDVHRVALHQLAYINTIIDVYTINA